MRTTALYPFAALAMTACTLGPNYDAPPAIGAPAVFARSSEGVTTTAPRVQDWWTSLADQTLDDLIRRGLEANPDIAIARARLRQARGSLRLEKANELPSSNASAIYLHGELPPTNLGAIGSTEDGGAGEGASRSSLDFYNLGFDASWEADFFGGKRRAVETARATAESVEAQLADVQVTLSTEIARNYVNLRDRQRRIELARAEAGVDRQVLDLNRRRVAAGTATRTDLLQLEQRIEDADLIPVPLAAERDAYLNALAVLIGEAPGALDAILATPGAVPLPPTSVSVGDPAALIARRPDIRAAERTLAAQTAKIGTAEAARFPKLSFMGLIGLGGSGPGDVLEPENLTALALPRLAWNVLDFGRNASRIEQAKGMRDEAEAQYRSTVLAALRDVEDSLSRFGARRTALAGAGRQKRLAEEAANALRRRFAGGTARITDVLNADRERLAAERRLVESKAAVTADYIALQKALGLGWRDASVPFTQHKG